MTVAALTGLVLVPVITYFTVEALHSSQATMATCVSSAGCTTSAREAGAWIWESPPRRYLDSVNDVVLVALIGIVGTLLGSVVGPIAKERLDRSARRKDSARDELRERVLAIVQILPQMVQTNQKTDPVSWRTLYGRLHGELDRMDLLLRKEDDDISRTIGWVAIFAKQGGGAINDTLAHIVSEAVTAQVTRWYRGDRKAEGLLQEMIDFWQLNYDGLVNGTLMPMGEVVPESELTDSEQAARAEYKAKQ